MKERQAWWGRVRGADGRQRWIKAVDLRPADDCAAFESVYVDENGVICSELLIWNEDGSRYREVIGGLDLTGLRDWEAASPSDAVSVPDDAGRKVWTHLDPEPVAELEPGPPAPAPVPAPYTPPVRGSVPTRDPQYEPPKPERTGPISRSLSWGPG